jgi:DNA-binding XRE family transcriptional regulator
MVKPSRYVPSPEGAIMRQIRETADLAQSDVADIIGISKACWGFIEVGRWRPSERVIRVFCEKMGLPRSMEERLIDLRSSDWTQPVGAVPTPGIKIKKRPSTKEMSTESA